MKGTSARFQMPTPLGASNAKKGVSYITYSHHHGGGIDILARIGKGFNSTIAVLELKDEPEPAEKAINQAIAYATFIRELLRSEFEQDWYHFFGFSGTIPAKLTLKVIIVMTNSNNACSDFANIKLPIGADGDIIELGYIYTAKERLGIS